MRRFLGVGGGRRSGLIVAARPALREAPPDRGRGRRGSNQLTNAGSSRVESSGMGRDSIGTCWRPNESGSAGRRPSEIGQSGRPGSCRDGRADESFGVAGDDGVQPGFRRRRRSGYCLRKSGPGFTSRPPARGRWVLSGGSSANSRPSGGRNRASSASCLLANDIKQRGYRNRGEVGDDATLVICLPDRCDLRGPRAGGRGKRSRAMLRSSKRRDHPGSFRPAARSIHLRTGLVVGCGLVCS